MVIGFTQGTFDLFHAGHLNLLKNAKSCCDYLIVGVNTDELVKSYKNVETTIPLEDRMAIIAELRCVDEVVATSTLDKLIAHERYHFDKMIIGDDWKGNPRWEQTAKDLNEIGVEMVWVPYTKRISSSKIRSILLNGN